MTRLTDLPPGMLRGPVDPDLFRRSHYGARWYIDPLPADTRWPKTDDSWPSVTTIKRSWSKPFRKKLPTGETVPLDAYWAAEYTVDHLDAIRGLDRDGAMALVATCGGRTLNKAARRGSGVHAVLEQLAVGDRPDPLLIGDDVRPFLPACEAFVADCSPRFLMSEVVAINRTAGYGGTADVVLDVPGIGVCMVDYKTRGGDHGAYEEEAAQIGGYSLAEYVVVIDPFTGALERVELPALDAGLVVSLTKDGYRLFPVELDDARRAFEAMHETWRHHREGTKAARASIGNPLVKPPVALADALTASLADADDADDARRQGLVEMATAAAGEADPERVEWVRGRIGAIVAGLDGRALPAQWPATVPTFKEAAATGHVHTAGELGAVVQWCDDVERELGLPFPDLDPATPPPARLSQGPEPAPAPAVDPHAEWADKGKALADLLDDPDLFRACAVVARCADTRMTRPLYLCLHAVVTQIADPNGAVAVTYGADGPDVVPDPLGAADAMAEAADGKPEALRRAKRLIKRLDLGIPSPRSLAAAAEHPLLAALVAAGHGADTGATNTNTEQENHQ